MCVRRISLASEGNVLQMLCFQVVHASMHVLHAERCYHNILKSSLLEIISQTVSIGAFWDKDEQLKFWVKRSKFKLQFVALLQGNLGKFCAEILLSLRNCSFCCDSFFSCIMYTAEHLKKSPQLSSFTSDIHCGP